MYFLVIIDIMLKLINKRRNMTKRYGSQGPKRKYIRGLLWKLKDILNIVEDSSHYHVVLFLQVDHEPWPLSAWSAYYKNIQEVAYIKNKRFNGKKGYLIRKTGKKLLSWGPESQPVISKVGGDAVYVSEDYTAV